MGASPVGCSGAGLDQAACAKSAAPGQSRIAAAGALHPRRARARGLQAKIAVDPGQREARSVPIGAFAPSTMIADRQLQVMAEQFFRVEKIEKALRLLGVTSCPFELAIDWQLHMAILACYCWSEITMHEVRD
jgi:hypothetical protein